MRHVIFLFFLGEILIHHQSVSQGSQNIVSLPQISSNPYTGRTTVKAGAYNPYTGSSVGVRSSTNPWTGAHGSTVARSNPYTGTTVRGGYRNPYTGTTGGYRLHR